MADLIKRQLTVDGSGGNTYTFTIPGLTEEIKIGMRMQDIRRRIDPTWDGIQSALDWSTQTTLRAAATFEVCLTAASVKWPFSPGKDGGPTVDSTSFPPDMVEEIMVVYEAFATAVARFRAGGAADNDAASAETVAS